MLLWHIYMCQAFSHTAGMSTTKDKVSSIDSNAIFKYCDKGIASELKFFTKGTNSLDLKYSRGDIIPGMLTVGTLVDIRDKLTPNIYCEFSNDVAHARGQITPVLGAVRGEGSCLFSLDKFKAGGMISLTNADALKFNYSVGGSYSKDTMTASVKTDGCGYSKLGKLIANVFAKNETVEVGGEVSCALTGGIDSTQMSIAGKYKLTKDSYCKVRMNMDREVALSIIQTLSPMLRITYGCQFNANKKSNFISGIKLNATV
eukprot:GHVR01015676.1.p1 GENE.GHVR01015676.1~~GHVR01015676.1.p1  ORF type:complete len:259 (+),score=48.37 GHVR01015676.1:220-996(+)